MASFEPLVYEYRGKILDLVHMGYICVVDENGKVTTLKAGTVTITAKAGDQTATVTITVQAASDPDVDSGCEDGCQNAAGSLVMVLALGAFLIVRKR